VFDAGSEVTSTSPSLIINPCSPSRSEWNYFDTDVPCLLRFSGEEIKRHGEEAETLNKSQDLRKRLGGVLTQGYTADETLDEAVAMLKEMRELGLESLEGGLFERETRWVGELGAEKQSIGQ
jgi:hypothetical protein